MNKNSKIIRVISASLIAIASLVMVILAIVNLVRNQGGESETLAFRIITCVMLILASILSTVVVISKDPKHFDVRLIVFDGLLLGAGIFVVLPKAGEVANTIVGWLIPCLIIGLGSFFIVATVISLINRINKRTTDVFAMIIGVLMLVVGILLLCFAERAVPVMWLIIGIILLVYSVFALIALLKKNKNANKPKEPEENKQPEETKNPEAPKEIN